jgi:hypothetical protein
MKRTTTKTCPKVLGLSLALGCMLPASARAEDDYCQKTRARAGSDAAILYAPAVRVAGVRVPQVGSVNPTDAGLTYQVRGELAFSPSSFYKGVVVERAADADCEAHRRTTTAQEIMAHASDLGRMPALRDEVRYLDAEKTNWDAIAAKMQERLDAKTVTVIEIEHVKARIVMLERLRVQVRSDLERLVATGFDPGAPDLERLAQNVEETTNRFEAQQVKVRAVAPWDVTVMGGYVPPVTSSKNDWYGVIQLTYSVGGPWHGGGDTRYLEARERELKTARYELPHQLGVLRKHVAIAKSQATAELEIVVNRMATITTNRAALAGSDSSLAPHALAMLDLEYIANGADKVYLEGLVRELGRMQEK